MKYVLILFLLTASLLLAPSAYAAKARTRSSAAAGSAGAAVGYSKARLSRGTNSVVITFINLSKVAKVTYTLSYTANGIEQGAVGSLTPTSDTDSRDVYFGTCSHGVCTPHRGIQNAVLLVETQLKNGRTNVKRYRIRI